MKELFREEFFQNTFIILFFIAAILLMFGKLWFNKRLNINLTTPNIYIFEYESRAQNILSFYNLNAFLFKILTYTLLIIAILKLVKLNFALSGQPALSWYVILVIAAGYLVLKIILEILLLVLLKKSRFLTKIRFIRTTYENYAVFYLFLMAFLIYYFPYQSTVFFYLIISISIIWIIGLWINLFNSLRKHTGLKSYQIFLYLCLSEILPFILVTGWIIFQIL